MKWDILNLTTGPTSSSSAAATSSAPVEAANDAILPREHVAWRLRGCRGPVKRRGREEGEAAAIGRPILSASGAAAAGRKATPQSAMGGVGRDLMEPYDEEGEGKGEEEERRERRRGGEGRGGSVNI